MATKASSKTTRVAKTPAKSAGKPRSTANKWANVQLPQGFKAITSGEYGEPWDYENNPAITGVVSSDVRLVESGTGRNKRESMVVTVETDDGHRYDVWESAALRPWFEAIKKGNTVSVVFQGYRDTGKASPMKVFMGAIAEDEVEDDNPITRAKRRTAARKTRG